MKWAHSPVVRNKWCSSVSSHPLLKCCSPQEKWCRSPFPLGLINSPPSCPSPPSSHTHTPCWMNRSDPIQKMWETCPCLLPISCSLSRLFAPTWGPQAFTQCQVHLWQWPGIWNWSELDSADAHTEEKGEALTDTLTPLKLLTLGSSVDGASIVPWRWSGLRSDSVGG